MKKYIFLLLFYPVLSFSQERIFLIGNIFDGVTFFPVKEANIYNFSSKMYSFTDKDGNFEILVRAGDTLIVSKQIYKQEIIIINQDNINKKQIDISLFYRTILLKEVFVYALPETYDKFKKDFANTNFSDYVKGIEGTTISDAERTQYSTQNGLLGLIPGKAGQAIRSPITFLYETFSRRAKMGRLYQELMDNQDEVDNLPLKYNRELVMSLTGLDGEDLLDFMTFCKFSYYELVKWSPEFIITQVKRKYDDYEFYKAIESN
jgi:hypothetical protein